MFGWKAYLIAGLILATASGIGYFYYKDTQATIALLTANNAVLGNAVQQNEQTIISMQEDYNMITEELRSANESFSESRRQNRELVDRLGEHDLGYLAINRPVLVERTINRATVNALRCMELTTGAAMTAQELEATNARAFNSECPWLWPNNP